MRNIDVTVFSKGGVGSISTKVEFNSVADFMSKVDEVVESVDFPKVELDFDASQFGGDELATLQSNNYLRVDN